LTLTLALTLTLVEGLVAAFECGLLVVARMVLPLAYQRHQRRLLRGREPCCHHGHTLSSELTKLLAACTRSQCNIHRDAINHERELPCALAINRVVGCCRCLRRLPMLVQGDGRT
jgi:hypothetical protein